MNDIDRLAAVVDEAAQTASAIPQLSLRDDFDVEDAYRIQASSVARRVARGERIIGVKMGFTSRAKAEQMGVSDVIYGWLTDAMRVGAGDAVSLDAYVHARVEPELAVRMGDGLEGDVSAAEAWHAVEAVAPAVEIIDSRYENFRFSLVDVIADNSSSSGFVIGDWYDKPDDASDLRMSLSVDGDVVQTGSTRAVLGDPRLSVAKAAQMLARRGKRVEAGWIVLTGGATEAVALAPGARIENVVARLGSVAFHTTRHGR
ncbi:MAG: fumarylacetoacetate hydrolase family protein [Proteobacteria bacterium]|nr:fumarylacetoacetate hydrolase family protein [Pseudomonadota bacterium]